MRVISSNNSYRLLQLQNRLKKDPPSYREEFAAQYLCYTYSMEMFKCAPSEFNKSISDLVMFLAHVSTSYKEDLAHFPNELMEILRKYGTILDPTMRMCFMKALILMRNKQLVPPLDLIKLCFELLCCQDKILRKQLHVHIVSDLKNLNSKHKNPKVNTVLQNFMFQMLTDKSSTAVKMSLDIMIELYRRNVWRDAKTVNAISTACFSKINKVLVAAHKFLLGTDQENEENKDSDSEDDDAAPTLKEIMMQYKVNKKSRKRMKMLKKSKQVLQKSKKKKKKEVFDFFAIHLLHDPQGMAEKLLHKLQSLREKYEIKLLMMDLISRLVGVHELILFNYYDLLVRYLQPRQVEVTKILMFAAQAAHEHVPPEAIKPIIKAITDNFITERNSGEAIAVGLNSIREICIRCPLAIEQDLLQDLVQYKNYKNKNVSMAARSLIQLFRRINPEMLQRKFRSRPTEATKDAKIKEFGALNAKSYIPGSEVLTLVFTQDDAGKEDDEEMSDDEEGWVDVSHSDDEVLKDDDEEQDSENEEGIDSENEEQEDSENEEEVDSENEEDKTASDKELNDDKNASLAATGNYEVKTNSENTNPVSSTSDSRKTENKPSGKSDDALQKAMEISQSRILSQEDFRKLKAAQIAKEVAFKKGKKRKVQDETEENQFERPELVSLSHIEQLHKKPRSDKKSRLATVQEGREDREKFGSKRNQKKDPEASKTNKEKRKTKAFMMIKYKVKSKIKRSFREKQRALKNSLLKKMRNR